MTGWPQVLEPLNREFPDLVQGGLRTKRRVENEFARRGWFGQVGIPAPMHPC